MLLFYGFFCNLVVWFGCFGLGELLCVFLSRVAQVAVFFLWISLL